uniref:Uncharacterized protein n=1 Tax=Callorhinchus milii TaxID=7868 RepID=A0A4W3HCH9_CALMI
MWNYFYNVIKIMTSSNLWALFCQTRNIFRYECQQCDAGQGIQSKLGVLGNIVQEKAESLQAQEKETSNGGNTWIPVFTKQTSDVLGIPNTSAYSAKPLDLYTSCSSICKSYTDLQIAGHITPNSCTSSGCFMSDDYELSSCNFSQVDDSAACNSFPASQCESQQLSRVDTFLSSDRSILLQRQPLTNSVLNNYMEQKIAELYKQYLQDCLAKCASPTKILSSNFLMANMDQISLQISQEKNMETTKAKDMVINCLLSVACAPNSSEISTPNLQISLNNSNQQTDGKAKKKRNNILLNYFTELLFPPLPPPTPPPRPTTHPPSTAWI